MLLTDCDGLGDLGLGADHAASGSQGGSDMLGAGRYRMQMNSL